MRSGRRGRKLHDVDSRSVSIGLELQVNGDDVRGHAFDAAGATRDFSGWLGLIAVLDDLVSAPPAIAIENAPAVEAGPTQGETTA